MLDNNKDSGHTNDNSAPNDDGYIFKCNSDNRKDVVVWFAMVFNAASHYLAVPIEL